MALQGAPYQFFYKFQLFFVISIKVFDRERKLLFFNGHKFLYLINSFSENTCMCDACQFCFCILCQRSSHGRAPCQVISGNVKKLMEEYNRAVVWVRDLGSIFSRFKISIFCPKKSFISSFFL